MGRLQGYRLTFFRQEQAGPLKLNDYVLGLYVMNDSQIKHWPLTVMFRVKLKWGGYIYTATCFQCSRKHSYRRKLGVQFSPNTDRVEN